jgi:DNA-binding NtrC family response regulator
MENIKKLLEILVVDDREENLDAAKRFFDTQENVTADYASDFQEAMKKMNRRVYAYAILDVELPNKKGEAIEKLGLSMGKEAESLGLPFVYLTAHSYEHHGTHACSKIFLDNFCLEHDKGKIAKNKSDQLAWKEAYETLKQVCCNPEIIVRSKERYLKTTEKMYRKHETGHNSGGENGSS